MATRPLASATNQSASTTSLLRLVTRLSAWAATLWAWATRPSLTVAQPLSRAPARRAYRCLGSRSGRLGTDQRTHLVDRDRCGRAHHGDAGRGGRRSRGCCRSRRRGASGCARCNSPRAGDARTGSVGPKHLRPNRLDGRGSAPRSAKRRPGTAIAVASCPYCANVLQPPPAASGRCPRCRQRIVVKRIADRAVYLTEAAVPVFEAERKRLVYAGRWTKKRDRWLDLALAGGAPADRVARLVREPVTEGVVAAARTLYVSTVERAFRSARRDRRWEEAARIRFGYALALYRLAASPIPPPQEIVRLHQDGLDAALRGISEVAKSAELRAGTCCEACRADDGQMVRIARELRSPRLPHPDCPKGLCRCRWYLADADRAIVTTLLKRKGRPHRHKADARA